MSYRSIEELPKSVRNLPKPAKTIYLKAFNSAWEAYVEVRSEVMREKAAHEAAWSVVREEYEKEEESGQWVKIGQTTGPGKSRHLQRNRRSRSAASQSRAHA